MGVQPVTVKRCLVDSAGTVTGDAPLALDDLAALPKMGGALDGHTAGDRPGIYVQPLGVPGTAYVFGAGHCGHSLIPLLSMVGFRTVIVDDRADFANAERFPDADSIVVPESFDDALASLPIDEQSYLVIMTRGHMFDRSVLAQALATPALYVGMIGSKKKVAETFKTLKEQGFTDDGPRPGALTHRDGHRSRDPRGDRGEHRGGDHPRSAQLAADRLLEGHDRRPLALHPPAGDTSAGPHRPAARALQRLLNGAQVTPSVAVGPACCW